MNLGRIMKRKNVTGYRLHKLSGVSQASISDYLAGKTQPTLTTLQKLAAALGVTIAELIGDEQAACMETPDPAA